MNLDSRLGLSQLGFLTLGAISTGVVTISPAGIPSEEAFGTPAIYQAGTLYPAGIPSEEAFGFPSFAQSITVSPTGIPSAEAFGTPSLSFPSFLQTVSPTGIPSEEAFGTPTVHGPLQTIVCMGIPSAEAFGFPSLMMVGAPYDKLRVFLNGIEFTDGIQVAMTNTASRLQQRSQATLSLFWSGPSAPTSPVVGQKLLLTENYRNEFAGYVTDVKASVIPYSPGAGDIFSGNWLLFAVTATDLSGIADRRKVMASYPPGAADQIVNAILSNELSEEGLTAVHVTVTAQTLTTVGGGQSLKQVLDQISKDTGGLWFIDELADVHLEYPGDGGAAPWSVTDSNDTVSNVSVETNLDTYANTVTARTNQTLQ